MRILFLAFLLMLILPGMSTGQKRTYHCRKTEQVIRFIQANHYAPVPIDSAFNNEVKRRFINTLDPFRLFFTKEDVKEISECCPDLVTLECNANRNFMERILDIYYYCLTDSEYLMDAVFSEPVDFNAEDSLLVPERYSLNFADDMEGLQENWEKYLKFQMLRYYFTTFQSHDTAYIHNENNFMLDQDTIRSLVMSREYCKINHILNYPGGFDNYIFGLYLNTVTGIYDPHTNYFSISDKNLFESTISKSKVSFGADLEQNDDGEIVVSHLVPGGPAWRSGEISTGDVLLSIRIPDNEPIDLNCSDLAEIQDLIYNAGSDSIELTVKNALGRVRTISLKMETLSATDNLAYSFILSGDRKIGYVALPGFYTEPDKDDPMGCASDLVREIGNLMADSIQGLILDIRNNGGGSIAEASDIAGIFIDSGPLCIYRKTKEKPALIKDLNPGTVYDGPLVLLVNGYSASASEILAGILQDYNRAVVVGSPTFGKASGQIIAPLFDSGTGLSFLYSGSEEPRDFLKVTTTRYYRLDGSSHQGTGIVPDIPLPAHAGFSRIKESSYPSALPNDSIRKDIVYDPLPPLPLEGLKNSSLSRVSESRLFNRFNQMNDSIRSLYEGEVVIPLEFDAFRGEYLRNKRILGRIDKLRSTPGKYYEIRSSIHNDSLTGPEEYRDEVSREIIGNLSGDYYLEEAYRVTDDLVKSTENKKKEGDEEKR